jgi:hypothetical protein
MRAFWKRLLGGFMRALQQVKEIGRMPALWVALFTVVATKLSWGRHLPALTSYHTHGLFERCG